MARILAVDDDRYIKNMLVMILEQYTHIVHAYEDAEAALTEIDFNHIDLIITDLHMPFGGDRFIRELSKKGIQIPIIVISGHVTNKKAQELLALGVYKIIQKPFLFSNLLKEIAAIQTISS